MEADLTLSTEEARRHLAMDEATLLVLLGTAGQGKAGYQRGGAEDRGRSMFELLGDRVRASVCREYRSRQDTLGDEVQIMVLVSSALLSAPELRGLPLVPLAALITKLGVARFCAQESA